MTPPPIEQRVAIVAGGFLDDTKRRDVRDGRRARIDVFELESRLHARVYDFTMLERAERTSLSARVLLALARRTGKWSWCLAVYATPRLRQTDVVYATGEDVGLPLALLLRLRRIRRPRIILRLEQPTYGRTVLRRLAFLAFVQVALGRVSRVLCRTTAHAQYVVSVLGVPANRVAFIPETTDQAFFTPVFHPRSGTPLVVAAGLEERDYTTLIEAVRNLPIEVVIAAASPWAQIIFQGSGGPLPSNVRVGAFTPTEMRELYRDAALVVVPLNPTLRACGMNVVLEAWASGRGVIVTRTAGQVDYGADTETVRFVAPHDSDDLRRLICELVEDPGEAAELGRSGRRLVEDHLNLDCYLARIEAEVRHPRGSLALSLTGALPTHGSPDLHAPLTGGPQNCDAPALGRP